MSWVREIVNAIPDVIIRLARLERDPCKVARRKARALIRAQSRRYPNRRRVKRLKLEVAHWAAECSNKLRKAAIEQ